MNTTVTTPHPTGECGQCRSLAPLLAAVKLGYPDAHINAWLGGNVHGVQIDLVDGYDTENHAPRYVIANTEGASLYDDWAAALEANDADEYDCDGRENIQFDDAWFTPDGDWTEVGVLNAATAIGYLILRHPCCDEREVPTHAVFCPEGNYGPAEVGGVAEWIKLAKQ